ncbi:MAG: hypothetical protein IT436_08305 [Phycisphaerales bacterium]|nr:hypothetical protein [Phycisphaerales bacterium]
MTQALSRYHALFESLKSRRRKPELSKGVDSVVGRGLMKLRHSRISLAWLRSQAEQIDALAHETRNCSEGVLDEHLQRIRERFVRGRQEDEDVRRALALTREIARRVTGEEPFVVQLMGALALYHGRVVEMLTGEGKTLTGSIVAPIIAWRRKHVHVFTVNDYLAVRDARSREPIYKRCLVTVGALQQETEPAERFDLYTRSIVYGTPKQIVADWLRDQIRLGALTTPWAGRVLLSMGGDAGAGPMVPGLRAAMVDEADAVLIDEGVVPLIIARSRREDDMAQVYREAAAIAAKLDEGPDYSIDHLRRRAELKRRGQHRSRQMWESLTNPIWRASRRAEELVRQALIARHCYQNGRQYQVVEGRIVIVDEYTGRFLPDRSWEHGLHQAVEAKEGLDVTADRETLARLSFQRFYRSYPFLCGMTGTAADATVEIERVYSRPVTVIPTNRPVARNQWPMRVFLTAESKWRAIVDSIAEVHALGRPQLVGTRSIAASELLARLLDERGLPHRVLNANFDKEEADLIAQAGFAGAITVATNMAGRGTDIKPDQRSIAAGGLHVILTEMHGAKRIDRQFIGRAGRQGDPGSAQTFVSLEDELVAKHARRLTAFLLRTGRLSAPGLTGELSGAGAAARLFRLAQRRSESRDRGNRSQVLRQDDWIDKHLPGVG